MGRLQNFNKNGKRRERATRVKMKTATIIRIHPNGFAFLAYEGELDGDELYLHRRQVQDLPSCTFESLPPNARLHRRGRDDTEGTGGA